jgi:hypothetical protein
MTASDGAGSVSNVNKVLLSVRGLNGMITGLPKRKCCVHRGTGCVDYMLTISSVINKHSVFSPHRTM